MDKMFCSRCGKENAADATFCNGCGSPIARVGSQPTQSTGQQGQAQTQNATQSSSYSSTGSGIIDEAKKMIAKEDFSTRISAITKPVNLWYLIGVIAGFIILISMFLPFINIDLYFYETSFSMIKMMRGGLSVAIFFVLILAIATMVSSFLRFGLGNIVCGGLGAFFGLIVIGNVFISSTYEGFTPGFGLILFILANVATCLSGFKMGFEHLKTFIQMIKEKSAAGNSTNLGNAGSTTTADTPIKNNVSAPVNNDNTDENR